jgi:AraC-like DNA-binding protein
VNRFSHEGPFVPLPGNSTFELHHHDFHELVVVHNGRAVHHLNTEQVDAAPGDVFLITPGMRHCFSDAFDVSLTNVMFISWRLADVLAELREVPGFAHFFLVDNAAGSVLRLGPARQARVRAITDRMLAESAHQPPGFKTALRGLLAELLVLLGRVHGDVGAGSAESSRRAHLVSRLQAQFNEHWTLEQMAEVAACSVPTLVRWARQTLGQSPTDYLLSLRIHHARRLLVHTDLTVTQIAEQTGFNDSNYLSRQFRKRVGVSPREYRRAAGGADR